MPRVEHAILRKILPSPEEDRRIQSVDRDVMRILETKIAAKGLAAKPLLVGSVAKGVHLTGTEIDIFVTFPPDTPREVLEREGLAFGDVLERPVRMYAEHPYTRGWYGGFEVEIVPCYRITDATQRMSAVDRTPLHVDYVLGHVKEGQTNEVRLLKAWAEGIGVYGAEAKVLGFSGYLCELLILKYASFRGVLDSSLSWRPGTVIVLEGPPARTFPEPLIVVDLVGKEALFLFELEVASLPKASRHEGPPVWVKNSKDFLDKWRRSPKTMAGPYLHGERWAVDVTREATTAELLVKGKWRDLGLGKDLEKAARKSVGIHSGVAALRSKHAEAWTRLFDKRFPWER